MITLENVQKTHPLVPIGGIYQLIDLRHRKRVLWACSVQVSEVHANSPLAVLLFYHYGICKPLRKENLLYCASLLQPPNLLPNSFDMLFSQSPWLLLLGGK